MSCLPGRPGDPRALEADLMQTCAGRRTRWSSESIPSSDSVAFTTVRPLCMPNKQTGPLGTAKPGVFAVFWRQIIVPECSSRTARRHLRPHRGLAASYSSTRLVFASILYIPLLRSRLAQSHPQHQRCRLRSRRNWQPASPDSGSGSRMFPIPRAPKTRLIQVGTPRHHWPSRSSIRADSTGS